jgi:transcriptional regulator with XRE-family HTH domain
MEIPIIDIKETGKNIRILRKKSGLTMNEIRSIFNFATSQAIYKWEYGKNLPTVDNLLILSKIFNVKIEDILIIKED